MWRINNVLQVTWCIGYNRDLSNCWSGNQRKWYSSCLTLVCQSAAEIPYINLYQSETFPGTITHHMVSDGLFGVCDMTTTWAPQNIEVHGLLFPASGIMRSLHEWLSVETSVREEPCVRVVGGWKPAVWWGPSPRSGPHSASPNGSEVDDG